MIAFLFLHIDRRRAGQMLIKESQGRMKAVRPAVDDKFSSHLFRKAGQEVIIQDKVDAVLHFLRDQG